VTALALALILAAGPGSGPASARTSAPGARGGHGSSRPARAHASEAGGAHAELPSASGPVRIDADQVKYVYPKRQIIFTGNPLVRMTRDDAVLTCRRLVAENDEDGRIVRAICTGEVKLERGTRTVTCESATFLNAEGRLVCEGHPVLQDGGTIARGDFLTYDLASDEVTLRPVNIIMPPAEVDTRQKEYQSRRKGGQR
jgi:lipopolysaccharide export system protein LptA